MSSEQGTSSSSGKGMDKGGGMSPVQSAAVTGSTQYAGMSVTQAQTEVGKDYVKDKLGLTNVTQTPVDAPPITTDMTATNLTGKDKKFYGQEASQFTNEYLEQIGHAKKTSKNPDGSWNYHLTSTGWKMKYGSYTAGQAQTPSAMGSGNPAGILTSTAISQPMFESQKNLQQMIGLGMMAVGAPMAGSMIYQSGKGSYNKYIDSFYNQQSSTSMAQNTYTTGNISNGQGNASDSVGTSTLDKSFSDTLVQDTSTKDKQIKLAMANQEIGEDERTFLKATKRTITAGMSTV